MKLKLFALALAGASAFLTIGATSAQAAPSAPESSESSVSPTMPPATIVLRSTQGTWDCPYEYFCIWEARNFGVSTMHGYWKCAEYPRPYDADGWGSWYNHQAGIEEAATFYTRDHLVWGRTGGSGSIQKDADFRPIYSLRNCG